MQGVNLDGLQTEGDSGRQWETAEDSGSSLLGVFRASKHEQETLGVIGSNRKQQEVIGSRSSILPNHKPWPWSPSVRSPSAPRWRAARRRDLRRTWDGGRGVNRGYIGGYIGIR